MLFLFICTEGESSEPAYIEALKNECKGQAPNKNDSYLEVIPIPLGGNHGHKAIFDRADEAITKYMRNLGGSAQDIISENDSEEKWIICDYDNMSEHNIEESKLNAEAQKRGFRLIINKPKFEFFVLLNLYSYNEACEFKIDEYEEKINIATNALNEENKKKLGENVDYYIIPKYSKKVTAAKEFFDRLLRFNPESATDILGKDFGDCAKDKYSDMKILIERIIDLFSY